MSGEAGEEASAAPALEDASSATVQREHLRGSTLMVAGRVLALGLNMVVQVVTVRYLGKSSYGAFAYGLSISSLAATAAVFGQGKSLGRYLPRFNHDGDHGRAQGALVLAFTTVFALGTALASLVIGLSAVGIDLSDDDRAATVLVILIATAPLLALDSLFVSVFAVVAKPTAIFFRRHVLTPALRLGAVVFVVATQGSLRTLAWAYLVIGVVGVLAYALLLVKVLRDRPLGPRAARHYPFREMWGFGATLVASDSVHALRTHLVVLFLEMFRSVEEVGAFRAVVPIAQVNLVALQAFELLYFPAVSRLFVRNDLQGIVRAYWRSAAWLMIGTFPVFVFTFAFAEPVTTLLFGSEFSDSARLLAVLSVGLYLHAALGLNTLTLKATGNARLFLLIDGITAGFALVANLWFVWQWGAMGAAVAATSTTVLQNVLTHIGLRHELGGLPLPTANAKAYGTVVLVGGGMWALQEALDLSVVVSVPVGFAAAAVVGFFNRDLLDLGDTLPELRRVPILRRLVR